MKIVIMFDHISSMDKDTPSGEWTNYDGWCGAESKHISFKISLLTLIFIVELGGGKWGLEVKISTPVN